MVCEAEIGGLAAAREALPEGFVVRGRLGGEETHLGWRGGRFYGEPLTVRFALHMAGVRDGKMAGPMGYPIIFGAEKSLQDPLHAYLFLVGDVFGEEAVEGAEGSLPDTRLPRGAMT